MPPVVAAIGWVAGAIGSISVGSGIVGAVVTGAIKGAIIGAIVGGATAAVTGTNIGEGMLKGAAGGALTGGVMGGIGHAVKAAQTTQALDSVDQIDAMAEAGKATEMLSAPEQSLNAADLAEAEALAGGADAVVAPPVAPQAGPVAGAGGTGQEVVAPGQMTQQQQFQQFMDMQKAQGAKEMYIQGGMGLAEGVLGTYQQEKLMEQQIAKENEMSGVLAGDYRAGFSGKGANIPTARVGAVKRPGPVRTNTQVNVQKPGALARTVQARRA